MNRDVLICSAGRRVALVRLVQETLAQMGESARVLTCDVADTCAAGHVSDGFFLVPPATSDEFLPAILSLCEEEGVSLVIPTTDPTLTGYAQAASQFTTAGVTVAISSPATVAIANDKRRTAAFFEAYGVRTVRQAEPEEVLRDRASWPLPLVVKPPQGSSSLGVDIVTTELQLQAAVADRDVVVQDVAVGEEYTIDLFLDGDGRLRDAVPRQRLAVRAGEVSKSVTVRAAPLMELAEQVANCLPGAFGVLNLQAFWDGTSPPVAIELNARFGGGFPLSHAAGAPFVRWLLESAWGLPLTPATAPWRDGLLMLRYDEAVLVPSPTQVIAR